MFVVFLPFCRKLKPLRCVLVPRLEILHSVSDIFLFVGAFLKQIEDVLFLWSISGKCPYSCDGCMVTLVLNTLTPWTVWWQGHKVENQGIKSMPSGGDFLFPKCQHQPWAPTSILFNGYCELLPRVKWLAGKTDHMHLSFCEYSIWCHGTHRDILHLYTQCGKKERHCEIFKMWLLNHSIWRNAEPCCINGKCPVQITECPMWWLTYVRHVRRSWIPFLAHQLPIVTWVSIRFLIVSQNKSWDCVFK